MKTTRLASAFAAALGFATRAAAHGLSQGIPGPHAHPHADGGIGVLGVALLALAATGAVALLVRAIAKRR